MIIGINLLVKIVLQKAATGTAKRKLKCNWEAACVQLARQHVR